MKRIHQEATSTAAKAAQQEARAVPLMVPHGGGAAGRDFESAFELLHSDEHASELWRRTRGPRKPAS